MIWDTEIEELVRRFAGSWSRRFRFGNEDSEDLEQDAVLLAFVKIRDGMICHRQGLWVLVRNLAFDCLRVRKPNSAELSEHLIVDFGSENRVLDRMVLEELSLEFPEFLAMAQARAAGYSWDEISGAFGVASGTLRVQWGRIGVIVRERLGGNA